MTIKTNYYYRITLILIITLLALLPQYLIRQNLSVSYWWYNHFTTYFGDLWYCWNNYLSQGFPYPREYPSLIQALFRVIATFSGIKENYAYYLIFPVSLLTICAICASYLLDIQRHSLKQLLLFWLGAPSFLFYALLNVDLLPILTIVISYYCYQHKHTHRAIIFLAIGTAIKVFPIFILPVYLLRITNKQRLQLIGTFVLVWLMCNLPFILTDYQAWLFPYQWQIQSNFARTNQDGSWTWILYQSLNHIHLGGLSGKISLALFAAAYMYCIRYYFAKLSIIQQITVVIILFLLTDRVYSPQYNLYLLPCLVLLKRQINLVYFYLLEIPNFLQGFFLFWFKDHAWLLQGLILIKYTALILILYQVLSTKTKNKR